MSSFICLEFVQNFFMSRICLEKISGIFHVQNLSSLFVQILSRFFSCLEYVQNLSGFLDMKNSRRSFFRTFSRHFLDMKKNSGQFPDNFDDIFRIFLFYRVSMEILKKIFKKKPRDLWKYDDKYQVKQFTNYKKCQIIIDLLNNNDFFKSFIFKKETCYNVFY